MKLVNTSSRDYILGGRAFAVFRPTQNPEVGRFSPTKSRAKSRERRINTAFFLFTHPTLQNRVPWVQVLLPLPKSRKHSSVSGECFFMPILPKAALTLVKTAFIVSIRFYPLSCLYIKHKHYLLLVYTSVAGV